MNNSENVEDKGEIICLNAHLTKILNRLLKYETFVLNKQKVLVCILFYVTTVSTIYVEAEDLHSRGRFTAHLCSAVSRR